MQKETLSFTQQKLFPLVWEEGLRPGPPLSLPRGSPGRRRVLDGDGDAAQPCCPLESAGSRASCRKALPAPPRLLAGRRAGGKAAGLPRELASQAGAQAARELQPWSSSFRREPSPALLSRVRAPQGGQRRQRAQWGHSAAPDRGVEVSAVHPSLRMPFSPRDPLLARLWGGEGDMVMSPCWDLLPRAPQPTQPPLFRDAKGPFRGEALDAEGSANSAQQAPGCCNLFMPTTQEVPDGRGACQPHIRDQGEKRCQVPCLPHGTPVTRDGLGGSSSPAQTRSVQRESIPAPTEGAATLEGGRGGGGGRELSHDHNSCFGGRCVFILLTHLLITKVLTLEPRCIRCSRRFAYFHWGSG